MSEPCFKENQENRIEKKKQNKSTSIDMQEQNTATTRVELVETDSYSTCSSTCGELDDKISKADLLLQKPSITLRPEKCLHRFFGNTSGIDITKGHHISRQQVAIKS